MYFCFYLFLLTLSHVEAGPSPGCGAELPPHPRPGEHERREVEVSDPGLGDVRREFYIHLPASYHPSNTEPVPLLLDYHWWGGSASSQVSTYPWPLLSDTDTTPFIYLALQGMADVEGEGEGWQGSWNVSRTEGPLGLTCDPFNFTHSGTCFTSCGDCSYLEASCDWTSCHDDVSFTEAVLYQVLDTFCVDTEHIHMSGISNGGMFVYTRALASLSALLGSVGGVASSPLRGFDFMPDNPVSIIDFHGLDDTVIPYDINQPGNLGLGPDGTVINNDGYYYTQKISYIQDLLAAMNCSTSSSPYPTSLDGEEGWECQVWSGCSGGAEIVQCRGHWGHEYPLQGAVAPFQIMWDFLKSHPNHPLQL